MQKLDCKDLHFQVERNPQNHKCVSWIIQPLNLQLNVYVNTKLIQLYLNIFRKKKIMEILKEKPAACR